MTFEVFPPTPFKTGSDPDLFPGMIESLALARAHRWSLVGTDYTLVTLQRGFIKWVRRIVTDYRILLEGEKGPAEATSGQRLSRVEGISLIYSDNPLRRLISEELWTHYRVSNSDAGFDYVTFSHRYAEASEDSDGLEAGGLHCTVCHKEGTSLGEQDLFRFNNLIDSKRNVFVVKLPHEERGFILRFERTGFNESGLRVSVKSHLLASEEWTSLWNALGGNHFLPEAAQSTTSTAVLIDPRDGKRGKFVRQTHASAHQLIGKPSQQLHLGFPEVVGSLSPQLRQQCLEHSVNCVGFDLSSSALRAFEAGLLILASRGYRTNKIVIRLEEWLSTYGVARYQKSGNRMDYSQKEHGQAVAALTELASKSGLIHYSQKTGENEYRAVQRIGPMWRLTRVMNRLTDEENLQARSGMLTDTIIKKMDLIEIEFDEFWLHGIENNYFWRPADLREKLRLVVGAGKKTPAHLHNFLNWLLSEAGRRKVQVSRGRTQHWNFEISLDELARYCRLDRVLAQGQRARVSSSLRADVQIAQKIGCVDSCDFNNDKRLIITVNPAKLYDGLEQQNQARQDAYTGRKGPEQLPLSRFNPNDLRHHIKDIKGEIQRLSALKKIDAYGTVIQDLDEAQKYDLFNLKKRLQQAEVRLIGVSSKRTLRKVPAKVEQAHTIKAVPPQQISDEHPSEQQQHRSEAAQDLFAGMKSAVLNVHLKQ